MSVTEIEAAITQLPAEKVQELMVWFEDYYNRVWDRQIETDLESGKLDNMLAEVDAEIESGLAKPL
jgi:hypothetical protein